MHYLSGEMPQGRIGIAYKALQAAASASAAHEDTLSIADVDRASSEIAGFRGGGSAARRTQALSTCFQAQRRRNSSSCFAFGGELRQGALAGAMVEAIAAAAGCRPPRCAARRCTREPGSRRSRRVASTEPTALGKIPARTVLARFRPCSLRPQPTLPRHCESFGAKRRSSGRWMARGSKCTRRRDEVRIYTRGLNEVTGAVPEIVETCASSSRTRADARRRGDRIRCVAAAASVSDHHAPLRPQAEGRSPARRACRSERSSSTACA